MARGRGGGICHDLAVSCLVHRENLKGRCWCPENNSCVAQLCCDWSLSLMINFLRDQRFISTCTQNGPFSLFLPAQVKTKLRFALFPDPLFAAPLFKGKISSTVGNLDWLGNLLQCLARWASLQEGKLEDQTKGCTSPQPSARWLVWDDVLLMCCCCHSLGFLGSCVILLTPA